MLRTTRLTLRQPTADDMPAYEVLDPESAATELRDAVAHWRAHGFGPWIVEADGVPVALLEIHYAGPGVTGIRPDEVEVGWAVMERARRRGIATEAASLAIDDAFVRADPRPPWIVAYIRPENDPSIRVAEKLGMRHVADGLTRTGDPMRIYRVTPADRARLGGGSATIPG